MRWSHLHIPTLHADPAQAEAIHHRLLVRAGFIRQLMAGHYMLLPLGLLVRRKIIGVMREEMNRIGCEFLMPAMHPKELWERTGRWETMGEELFRLQDRRKADLALGMTHEEVFTSHALELNSYRQLPQIWYQFQTKFRDEPRPRSGLIRCREFTMKDSYSFDIDIEGLDVSFERHRQAYERIFTRLGIPSFTVNASSGTMGGNASLEFMCPSDAGEDVVVICRGCGYAANLEMASSRLPTVIDPESGDAPHMFATPGVRSIDDLARDYEAPASQQIKTLAYMLDGQMTLVLLRGDHNLAEQKLRDLTGAVDIRSAAGDEIRTALGAGPGSLGAVGVRGFPIFVDEALRDRRNMFTGANRDGFHLGGVDVARDLRPSVWADLREVATGEECPQCGRSLKLIRAIEVGHIFKLGYTYSEKFGVRVSGPRDELVHPIMGCYGIGVERAMAAIVECHHDEAGLVWPLEIAPFSVVVTNLNPMDTRTTETSESIYDHLVATGVEALLDDRPLRAGAKFKDADLIGIPFVVTVGPRGLAQGEVELKSRASGETRALSIGEVPSALKRLMNMAVIQ